MISYMKEAIEKFCKARENGLFLLDMPTGFGKTYSVLEFIADNYDKEEYRGIKFFFVTTLKKNLPYNKLKEHFESRGKGDDFDRFCMQIDANADAVIENLMPLYRARKIPIGITQKPEFKELLGSVQLIVNYQDKKTNEAIANLCKNAKQAIRDTQERAFRNLVLSELARFRTPNEKLKEIANNPEYHWIGELYPAVYTREKRIYFMSMDKFILGNSTLIEPTYSFYNNKIIDKAIIFIDEFDATRDRMLNQIIKRGLDNHVDYLTLFTQVYSSLKMRSFPAELTTDSDKQKAYLEEHPRAKNCGDIISGFETVVGETYDRFSMQYSFKTADDSGRDTSRNFLFNDLQFHSVFAGDNSFVQITSDHKAKQNWLKFSKKRPTDEDSGVLGLLASVKGCVSFFQNGCRSLSYNYMQLQDAKKQRGDDDFTLENAIASVLREFHLSPEYRRYLTPLILSGQATGKTEKRSSDGKLSLKNLDRSVYDKGFRYYDFIDDPNHNMQSEIQLYDFQDSPERILLRMSERARVVGISATATIDTVVGNYDLEYLQRMLQDSFYELPDDDDKRLRDDFAEFTADYKKVDIHVEPVSFVDDYPKILQEIFTSQALIKKYTEKLEDVFSGSNKYAAANFLRIVKVLKAFICNTGIRSFLCLSNKLPQDNKGSFDLKLIKEIANEIIKEAHLDYKADSLIVCITSEEYDAKYNEMINRLSAGEKLFVLSSYNTVGAGQNLQYKTPEGVNVVEVNAYARGDMEKDFDGIYLEKPTNLIVNVDAHTGVSTEDLIRFIYQMEFLMERGEISRKDGIARIKDAFVAYSGGNTWSGKKGVPYETLSVNNFAIRTLIQAVGRICRTGRKNKDIYIYVDDEILKHYDLSKVEKRMLNPEFWAIVELGKQYSSNIREVGDPVARLENAAGQLSLKTMQIINELKRNWTEDSIDYWQRLRQLCLMCPTMSRDQVEKSTQFRTIYMQAPGKITSYSYEQEGDYNKNIIVKFDDNLSQKMSEQEVNLQELFNIEGLKEYFTSKRYATSFKANEFILTPPMFNNIYKGALGEVVGKYIFETYLSVELQDLPDEYFELFDYTIGDGIFIDFKLWKDTMRVDAEEEKQNILTKLEKCNGRRAIIVNIVYDRNSYPVTSDGGRIVEIPYLYRSDRHELGIEMLQKIQREGYLI